MNNSNDSLNISNKLSLLDTKNYNTELDADISEITESFYKIMNEYLFHITDNILIQNIDYYIFIIIRGFNMLKHIFNVLLLYTKNLSLSIHHCKKAYLFYVEFIGQIGNDNHSYLQLNSKDAILFVYKKTIFEINNEFRKQFELKLNEKDKFKYVDKLTSIYTEILEFVINNENLKSEKKMSYIMYVQKMSVKVVNKIILSKKNILEKIDVCEKFIYYKKLLKTKDLKLDECLFFNLSNFFLKKIQTKNITKTQIYNKIFDDKFRYNIENMSSLKFNNWLFNGK
jgi:hypothetical protein